MEFKKIIINELHKKANLKKELIETLIEIPPKQEFGDYAFPCFILAKEYKKNPNEIAKELKQKINLEIIEKIEDKGAYLNFFIKKHLKAEQALLNANIQTYGTLKEKGTILVEFPSPNTNKPLHIGHLRNMVLGESICRIEENAGKKVIRANLLNDRGIHICKSMIAYQKFGEGKNPEAEGKKSDHFVGEYYVKYSKENETNPKLEEETRQMLQKWEQGDEETIKLWKKMNEWAEKGFKETYKKFGIKHDIEYKESEIYKEGKEIVMDGLKKGILKKTDDGAVYAELEPELPNKIMLRKDGTSIYITQDLYLTKRKFEDFKLDESIWVVANEQDLALKQLFKISDLLKIAPVEKMHHLSYGMVALPEGRLKSREGKIIDADNLLDEVKESAKEEIQKRYAKMSAEEIEERAMKIALAAISFLMIKIDSKKDFTFNPKESVRFDGETGPYLLYTYARAKSILRKAKKELSTEVDFRNYEGEKQEKLIKIIGEFETTIKHTTYNLSPHTLAHYLLELASEFNSFYHEEKVIGTKNEEELLLLVGSVANTLKKGLYLLNINVIEEM